MIRTLVLAGLVLAVLAVSAPAQKDKEKAKVYKTPQEVFDAHVAAEKKGDFKTLASTLAPVAQKEFGAVIAIEFAAGRAELKASKEEKDKQVYQILKPTFDVLDKHGLTEKATKDVKKSKDAKEREKSKKVIEGLVKDHEAFLADMLSALDKLGGNPKTEDKLTELKVDGDKATGVVVSTYDEKLKKKPKKEPVSFVKINDSWRIIPSMKEEDDEKPKDK